MTDCDHGNDCRHGDPLDCLAAKDGVPIEDLLEEGSNGCDCPCHEEEA